MIQMRPSVAVSAVVNSIRQFYDAGSGVTQTTMLGASGSAPALYEDFTTGQSLDPRITFTRASSATRLDSTGTLVTMASNEPRFDYDPVTLQPKGLLIEEQRTNLLFPSESFSANAGCVVTNNAALSPLSTQSAATVVEDSSLGIHAAGSAAVTVSAVSTTISIYAKAAGRNWILLRFQGTSRAYFNLSSGTVGTVDASTVASITPAGNGYYRCSITLTPSAGTANVFVRLATGDGVDSYQGNGTSGVSVFGIQTEAGAFPTSYIPTTTAAATRAADVAVMTGTNFSSWYNQTEGTLFAEAVINGTKASSAFVRVQNAGFTEYIQMRQNAAGTQALAQVVSAGGSTPGLAQTNYAIGVPFKLALANKASDAAASFNGGAVSTSSASTSVPVVDRLNLYDTGSYYIRRIAYYPRRLSNSELQAITA